MRVQPDGRIIIAGGFQFYDGVKRPETSRGSISDGSLDAVSILAPDSDQPPILADGASADHQ